MDMLCLMHEGQPYGHLKVGRKVIDKVNLASMVGEALADVEVWLEELDLAGVYSKTPDGTIISRRMIRDESLRRKRAAGGKLGGNPKLMVNLEDNQGVKQKPTPSSSSSSPPSSTPLDIKNIYSLEFDQAWKDYPKRANNPEKGAWKAWAARVKEGSNPHKMRSAAENYATWCTREGKDGHWIMQAKTFYGPGGRWEEFADGVPKAGVRKGVKHFEAQGDGSKFGDR